MPNQNPFSLHELDSDSPASVLAAAKELLLEYGAFVAAQPSIATFCYGDLKNEAANLPQSYLSQDGGSLVARCAGSWSGFIAWRTLPAPELASAWELKRLWIRPSARGLGVGRALVQAVIDRALAAGKSRLLLDTAPDSMAAAVRLYQEMGFTQCEAYYSGVNSPPLPGVIFMSKSL